MSDGRGVGQIGLPWRGDLRGGGRLPRPALALEVVRHEDLSAYPVPAFATLHERLGLPFGPFGYISGNGSW